MQQTGIALTKMNLRTLKMGYDLAISSSTDTGDVEQEICEA